MDTSRIKVQCSKCKRNYEKRKYDLDNWSGLCRSCAASERTFSERKNHLKIYRRYRGMIERCTDKKHKAYKDYGGRGIKVSQEWINSFDSFLFWFQNEDKKTKCKNTTIERINNDGHYSPKNCTLISKKKQAINKRIYITNSSGYTGIRARGKSFVAEIRIDGKSNTIGTYKTKELALNARNSFILKNNVDRKTQKYKG